jgi:DNA-directed RNA polymerase specialized sigma24 family protein
MALNPTNSPEKLDILLDWLNPDRERASSSYLRIRTSLVKIFQSRKCLDAEELADQTMDRVMERAADMSLNFEGDPTLYFYGVGKNVLLEYSRRQQVHLGLYEAADKTAVEPDPDLEFQSACFDKCLVELDEHELELITSYYSHNARKKGEFRRRIAKENNITIANLRIRVFRIRNKLRECVENCCDKIY